jgi:hypothetical protein
VSRLRTAPVRVVAVGAEAAVRLRGHDCWYARRRRRTSAPRALSS